MKKKRPAATGLLIQINWYFVTVLVHHCFRETSHVNFKKRFNIAVSEKFAFTIYAIAVQVFCTQTE